MSRTPYHNQLPIVPGLTVIEASAGTGKTHQITNLVMRLIADKGMAVREIVVVTFTRAATAELRDRIRERLQTAAAVLEQDVPPGADTALSSLLESSGTQHALWAERLRDALRDFDQILISTIHGFCQRMLTNHAFASESDLDLELIPDTRELIATLVDDYLDRSLNGVDSARYRFLVNDAGFTRTSLARLATAATDDPDLQIEPQAIDVSDDERRAHVAQLVDRWVGAEGQAIRAALHDGQAHFKPRARKYRPDKVDEAISEVIEWLQAWSSPMQSAPKAVKYLDPAEMTAQLVDTDCPITYPPTAADLLAETQVFSQLRTRLATFERVRFAHWVRTALAQRCEAQRLQTYSDQLRGLAQRLTDTNDPSTWRLIAAIGEQYRVALIDEFQDTDAVQWRVFRTLFGPWTGPGKDPRGSHQHHLFLIGDPKQAIYSFRGANLHVYLSAVQMAEEQSGAVYSLGQNWRSDPRLVAGLGHRLNDRPQLFGDTRIKLTSVQAARKDRLQFPQNLPIPSLGAALDIRFFDATLHPSNPTPAGPAMSRGAATSLLTDRVAADIVEVLEAGLTIEDRPITPGDVAVLVRGHSQASLIQWALQRVGVPAVRYSAGNVFHSSIGNDVLAWLRAIGSPHRSGLARIAATTSLFGWRAVDLDQVDADQAEGIAKWTEWTEHLRQWRDVATQDGIWVALSDAIRTHRVQERLLERADGERRVADLLHLSELLHRTQTQDRMGISSLIQWLENQRSSDGPEDAEAEVRLDRDDEAVAIRTVHASKGLQYPIVFIPFGWTPDGVRVGERDMLKASDPAQPTQRVLDLNKGDQDPEKRARLQRSEREAIEEGLRLSYVSLTRAEHKCVVYTGHVSGIDRSAAASLWYGDGVPEGSDSLTWAQTRVAAWADPRAPQDADGASQMWSELQDWMNQIPALDPPIVGLRRAEPLHTITPWAKSQAEPITLTHRVWGTNRAGVDHAWGRHSYSGLARLMAGQARSMDDSEWEGVDHDQESQEADSAPATAAGPVVPLSEFPAGADAGTCLHAMFEYMDFADGASEQRKDVIVQQLHRHGLSAGRWEDTLVGGLQQVLHTPLGGPLGRTRLADIPRSDRLDELRFDLPIAGGDRHQRGQTSPTRGRQLADALRLNSSLSPAYLNGLSALHKASLAGFLNGAIDLVFRTPDSAAGHRWYVADYKSNRIATRHITHVPVTTYNQERMSEQMVHHHYLLQLHLYTLVLHRFLRHRLPNYNYDEHVGGAAYLFIRGMIGTADPSEPGTHGVFHFRPEASVIEALDTALEGGSS